MQRQGCMSGLCGLLRIILPFMFRRYFLWYSTCSSFLRYNQDFLLYFKYPSPHQMGYLFSINILYDKLYVRKTKCGENLFSTMTLQRKFKIYLAF